VLAQHRYQIQRRRFGDAEAGQACVRLPTMMGLVIEESYGAATSVSAASTGTEPGPGEP
jgi:hypothetical protein